MGLLPDSPLIEHKLYMGKDFGFLCTLEAVAPKTVSGTKKKITWNVREFPHQDFKKFPHSTAYMVENLKDLRLLEMCISPAFIDLN